MKTKTTEQRIRDRFFRRVIAHPRGAIVHHGDCHIYSFIRVCTCGLHHDLLPLDDELRKTLYPKFWEEMSKSYDREQLIMDQSHGEIFERCPKCKGEHPSFDSLTGGPNGGPCDVCKGEGYIPYVMWNERPKPKCPHCDEGELENHLEFPEELEGKEAIPLSSMELLIPCKKCNKCGAIIHDNKKGNNNGGN